MPLNKVNADSIADGTVVASDIADGTITLAKLQSGLLPTATANSAAAYANAAFATANTGTASGSYANSAFATANTASASGSYANSAFSTANTASTNATNAGGYANSAFSTANTASTNATNAGGYANSAFAKANTAGTGTVTSVATGNGLQGGTITTSGTLSVACPTHNTVGSYVQGFIFNLNGGSQTTTFGSNYSAGTGNTQVQAGAIRLGYDPCAGASLQSPVNTNSLSGTWKSMSSTITMGNAQGCLGLFCRVS